MRIARTRGIQEDCTEGGIAGNAAEQQLGVSLNWTVLSQCPELEKEETEEVLPLRTSSHHPREPPRPGQGALQSWKVPCRSEERDFLGTEGFSCVL